MTTQRDQTGHFYVWRSSLFRTFRGLTRPYDHEIHLRSKYFVDPNKQCVSQKAFKISNVCALQFQKIHFKCVHVSTHDDCNYKRWKHGDDKEARGWRLRTKHMVLMKRTLIWTKILCIELSGESPNEERTENQRHQMRSR